MSKTGFLVPYREGEMLIPMSAQEIYSLGFNNGVEYCRALDVLVEYSRMCYANWLSLVTRIQEAAQMGEGQPAKLAYRLRLLNGELSKAGTKYVNALDALKPHYRQDTAKSRQVEDVINGVKRVTSDYQDEISLIIEGVSDGERLRSMHSGEDRFEFTWFNSGVSTGGRPRKDTLEALWRLSKHLIKPGIKREWAKWSSDLWDTIESKSPDQRSKDECLVYDLWKDLTPEQRKQQLRKRF